MSKTKAKTKQLRLLLPEDWIPELDSLAASRFQTRLGLIRQYLRIQMNEELSNLAEHFKQTTALKKTHRQLQQHIEDRER
jgi:DNA-binding transcriptional regulator/RsmH inhibitor MraZ